MAAHVPEDEVRFAPAEEPDTDASAAPVADAPEEAPREAAPADAPAAEPVSEAEPDDGAEADEAEADDLDADEASDDELDGDELDADEPESDSELVYESPATPVPVKAPVMQPAPIAVTPPPEPATPAATAAPEEAPEPEEDEEPGPPEIQPVEGSAWYILQTYSGFENRVKRTIEEKLRVANLGHLVEEIFVPGEDVTRVKAGRKRTMHVIYFPGYVLIKMLLSDELWHLLMDIPRVAGFVGGNNREPQPLDESELSHIRSQMSEGFRQATMKEEFEVGQQVIVIDGPFANFSGKIDEVNVEKNKLRVLISILGRSTPVELDFEKVKPHPDAS